MSAALRAYLPLALLIARGIHRRLPPWVLRDDIEQAALIGLWRALEKDPGEHTPQERAAYMRRRIRGAIFDELRRQDWAPRRKDTTRTPRPVVVRIDDLGDSDRQAVDGVTSPTPCPSVRLDVERALCAPLNPIDRRCVELVLLRGGLRTEAARVLGMSEPRVHQRLHRAIEAMRDYTDHEKHLRTHRTNRTHPGGARALPVVAGSVRGRGLGGPPASAAARPVPGRAGRAELGGAPRQDVPAVARVLPLRPKGSAMNAKSWAQADESGRELRVACAKLRADGKSYHEIAAELHTLPEVVELVLNDARPLRKCGP